MRHLLAAQTLTTGMLIVCAAVVSFTPVVPHDFWWHMAVGRLVATQGIPQTNLFAWTVPLDQPYVYGQWLGGWLFYTLYTIGGPGAPVVVRNTLGLIMFWLLGVLCYQRSRSWPVTGVLLGVAALLTSTNLYLRPQVWAWVPCLLVLWIVDRHRASDGVPMMPSHAAGSTDWPRRIAPLLRLAALPVLLAFWVNVHGSFVLGLAILAAAVVGDTITALLRWPGRRPWRQIVLLAAAGVASAGATLLNPLGAGIFAYVQTVAANPTIRALIQEWQPPQWNRPIGASFYLVCICGGVMGALRWRRFQLADALLFVGCAALALTSQRMIFWFTLLTLPLLARGLAPTALVRAEEPRLSRVADRPQPRRVGAQRHGRTSRPDGWTPSPSPSLPRQRMAWMMGIVLLAFATFQPPLRALLPWQALVRQAVIDLPGAPGMYSNETPVAATAYLAAHPLAGPIFNDVGIGSYLIWALGPAQPVFLDPRVELFPRTIWDEYLLIGQGVNYNELLINKYHIVRIILNRRDQAGLTQALALDPQWRREYFDPQIEIYRRTAAP